MHADSLLWQRDLLDAIGPRAYRPAAPVRRAITRCKSSSSVTKSPKGQNYDANGADTDTITALAITDCSRPRTWSSLCTFAVACAEIARLCRGRGGAPVSGPRPISTACWPTPRETVVGGMLSIEGLQDFEGKIANLDVLLRCRLPHGGT